MRGTPTLAATALTWAVVLGTSGTPALAADGQPTLTAKAPPSVGMVGQPVEFDVKVDNAGGPARPKTQLRFDLATASPEDTVFSQQLVLERFDQANKKWQRITVTDGADETKHQASMDLPLPASGQVLERMRFGIDNLTASIQHRIGLYQPGETKPLASAESVTKVTTPETALSGLTKDTTLKPGGPAVEFAVQHTNRTGSHYPGIASEITIRFAEKQDILPAHAKLEWYDAQRGWQPVEWKHYAPVGIFGTGSTQPLKSGASVTNKFRLSLTSSAPAPRTLLLEAVAYVLEKRTAFSLVNHQFKVVR